MRKQAHMIHYYETSHYIMYPIRQSSLTSPIMTTFKYYGVYMLRVSNDTILGDPPT